MCIRTGNNSSEEKNNSLLPTAEFFIVMWCIQEANVGRGNETDTGEVFFFQDKEEMLYPPPQSGMDVR